MQHIGLIQKFLKTEKILHLTRKMLKLQNPYWKINQIFYVTQLKSLKNTKTFTPIHYQKKFPVTYTLFQSLPFQTPSILVK